MHDIWHDLQHGLLHFDNGIFYTSKQLLIRPGHTIREFLEGKRVRHFKPLSFVVVLATLYGFFYHNTISHLFEPKIISPNENVVEAYVTVIRWNIDHFAISNLLLIVVTATASFYVFKKRGYDYAEHLVLNTYLRGLVLLVSLLTVPFIYFNRSTENLKWFALIIQVVDFSLMYWCYAQFFDKQSKGKTLVLTLLTFLINSAAALAFGYLASWLVNTFR
jgi:hypothetical protein